MDHSIDSLSDETLIKQMAAGDAAALDGLYQRYSQPLFNFLLRIMQDEPAAEEVLQETFLAVWKQARDFRRQSSVKTWCYHIGHHQAVSWLRRQKRLTHWEDLEYLPGEFTPEHQAELNAGSQAVQAALSKLSPEHRAVVELSFVHELTYPEIAQVVGCPVGTVKSRMSYALRFLKGALLRG